jgi:tetratricopeptide (TPR) repeat protein
MECALPASDNQSQQATDELAEEIAANFTLLAVNFEQHPETLDDAICQSEELLACAPAKLVVPPVCFKFLQGFRFAKFQRTQSLDDLRAAIAWSEQAVEASADQQERMGCMETTAGMMMILCPMTRDLDDLENLIVCARKLVVSSSADNPKRARFVGGLSDSLRSRYVKLMELTVGPPNAQHRYCYHFTLLGDIEKAIECAEDAVSEIPEDDPSYSDHLLALSDFFANRYLKDRVLEDLNQAIKWNLAAEVSIEAAQPAGTTVIKILDHQCLLLQKRVNTDWDLDDLEMIITKTEKLLDLTDHLSTPNSAECLDRLAGCYISKYRLARELKDMDRAVDLAERAVNAALYRDPRRALYVLNLTSWLLWRYQRTATPADIEWAIAIGREAQKQHRNSPEAWAITRNLGTAFWKQYRVTGAVEDHEQATQLAETALKMAPLDGQSDILQDIANLLADSYMKIGDFEGLEHAIRLSDEAAASDASPANDAVGPERKLFGQIKHTALLILKFKHTKRLDDLEEALKSGRAALAQLPIGHDFRREFTNNLSVLFAERYQYEHEPSDLDEAILLARESAGASSQGFEPGIVLVNLAGLLLLKFKDGRDAARLEEAMGFLGEAEKQTPKGQDLRENVGELWAAIYGHTNGLQHLNRALEILLDTLSSDASPACRVSAAVKALELLCGHCKDHRGSVKYWSEVAAAAAQLLPLVSPRSINQTDSQRMLQKYPYIVSVAASSALAAGKSAEEAVIILEHGRGIITSAKFETRSDITDLYHEDPERAQNFQELRNMLDSQSDPSSSSQSTIPAFQRQKAAVQLDEAIKRIRRLPRFEQFLLPPTAAQLKAAACSATVIVINVSPYSCEAFIIQPDKIRALPLPRLRLSDCEAKATSFRSNYRTQTADALEWLWDSIAGPILEELRLNHEVRDDKWPRICWIPTGSLCLLPIHAAGYHFDGSRRTVLDRAISSYSPSVKALLYAKQNRMNRDYKSKKFVFVPVEETPDFVPLPFVRQEVMELDEMLPSSFSRVQLDGRGKVDVLDALYGCIVFHFAGHGMINPDDPSKSCLLLADGCKNPLMVKDLNARKLHERPPLLAYLSACSTGRNQAQGLLDEGIHLMGACQLAGFQHVIGSVCFIPPFM